MAIQTSLRNSLFGRLFLTVIVRGFFFQPGVKKFFFENFFVCVCVCVSKRIFFWYSSFAYSKVKKCVREAIQVPEILDVMKTLSEISKFSRRPIEESKKAKLSNALATM